MVKKAQLYRVVTQFHTCPWGVKAKNLLEREGFLVDDQHLKTHEEIEAFRRKHHVADTPRAWIDGDFIGGYHALLEYFGQQA